MESAPLFPFALEAMNWSWQNRFVSFLYRPRSAWPLREQLPLVSMLLLSPGYVQSETALKMGELSKRQDWKELIGYWRHHLVWFPDGQPRFLPSNYVLIPTSLSSPVTSHRWGHALHRGKPKDSLTLGPRCVKQGLPSSLNRPHTHVLKLRQPKPELEKTVAIAKRIPFVFTLKSCVSKRIPIF